MYILFLIISSPMIFMSKTHVRINFTEEQAYLSSVNDSEIEKICIIVHVKQFESDPTYIWHLWTIVVLRAGRHPNCPFFFPSAVNVHAILKSLNNTVNHAGMANTLLRFTTVLLKAKKTNFWMNFLVMA